VCLLLAAGACVAVVAHVTPVRADVGSSSPDGQAGDVVQPGPRADEPAGPAVQPGGADGDPTWEVAGGDDPAAGTGRSGRQGDQDGSLPQAQPGPDPRPPVAEQQPAAEHQPPGELVAEATTGDAGSLPAGVAGPADQAPGPRWTLQLVVGDAEELRQLAASAAGRAPGPVRVVAAAPPAPQEGAATAGGPDQTGSPTVQAAAGTGPLDVATPGPATAAGGDQTRGLVVRAADWTRRNRHHLVAAGTVAAGLAVTLTGFGGPLAAAAVGGALLGAGGSVAAQQLTKAAVDWEQAVVSGLVGGLAGPIGLGAGMLGGGAATAWPGLRGAVAGGLVALGGGMANRGLHGENPLDPSGMVTDLAAGGTAGGFAGRLGAAVPAVIRQLVLRVRNLPDTAMTTGNGIILVDRYLSGGMFEVVLRHETVHSFLRLSPLGSFTFWLYWRSHLWRYLEEVAAQTYATRSLPMGLALPWEPVYELAWWRVFLEAHAVTLPINYWISRRLLALFGRGPAAPGQVDQRRDQEPIAPRGRP